MKKRIYRAVNIKSVDVEELRKQLDNRVVFGCDAAKEDWKGCLMRPDDSVVKTIKWQMVPDHGAIMALLDGLRERGVSVEIAIEPTGTYADAVVHQLREAQFPVYRVSPKHSHDYSEIYDGVPSSHDGKSAAVVAKLHLEGKSRLWAAQKDVRRTLRAQAMVTDWVSEDIKRYESRLEARLARHWPEVLQLLSLDSASARALVKTYGDPHAVACDEKAARQTLRKASRGKLPAKKIDDIIESAKATIGVPMVAAEREIVQAIGEKLDALVVQQKVVDTQLEQAALAEPATERMSPIVGKKTSAVLVGMLGDFADYDSVRGLQRSAGMNLRVRSSGKQKGKLKLTKRGSSAARRYLFLASMRWVRQSAIVRAWYERKYSTSSGNKMKALVALMRKLLAGLYHVARGKELDLKKLFDVRGLAV